MFIIYIIGEEEKKKGRERGEVRRGREEELTVFCC
jgi:hypothetical protein